jgi:deazaflavin-dependent oxidoreductase (nitroreductase family)
MTRSAHAPDSALTMDDKAGRPPKLPPAWFKHAFWRVHRMLYRLTGGRFLWTPASKRGWGTLHLTTVGRKSRKARHVIVGYLEYGRDVTVLAMNGWDEGHPSWWLNVEADPDVVIRLPRQGPRPVRARLTAGDERERIWQRWLAIEPENGAIAARRTIETPVVVLELRNV